MFTEEGMTPFERWEAAREHEHAGVAVKLRMSAEVRRKTWE
jgi:hypothetical protein